MRRLGPTLKPHNLLQPKVLVVHCVVVPTQRNKPFLVPDPVLPEVFKTLVMEGHEDGIIK